LIEPLRHPGLASPHGFFTRAGGVSAGPYTSLNCSRSSQDDPAAVRENRARAAQAVGGLPEALVAIRQVHGAGVVHATAPWPPGEEPSADGVVTDRQGVLLGIVTADCAPVLFADAQAGIVGAAHAGWRGAVGGVLEATAAAMVRLGASNERIVAVIGPCIGQMSYEVGPDLRDAVLAEAPWDSGFFAPGRHPDRWQFDLRGYCRARLARSGVGLVHDAEADTAAEPDRFFSHRRRVLAGGGPIGHQISVIRT
jgi:YfiH family protein